MVDGHLALARLKQAQGDGPGALELTRRIEPILRQLAQSLQLRSAVEGAAVGDRQPDAEGSEPTRFQWYLDQIAACRVRLWLMQGQIGAASQWARTRQLSPVGEITYYQEVGQIALARVLIAQGEYDRAMSLLGRLSGAAEAGGRMARVIELLALQALTLQAQGQAMDALTALERALRLAEPEGFIRTFADEGAPMAALLQDAQARRIMPSYVETLLAAFPDDDKVTSWQGDKVRAVHEQTVTLSPPRLITPSLVEPLTERELQVLRLMAAGASNQVIAQKLVITIHTVKKHVGIIFGKLGVASRTEAVARARELSIL
jgi:LuxR family maltose regulon positive regulatory protein